MFVNHFSNPVLFVLLCTLCFTNPTLNGIVFAFVCLLILVLLHNTYSIKHPKNKSKNVSITKKYFSLFFHCKRKEKITVSLTHISFATKTGLLQDSYFLLALCLL